MPLENVGAVVALESFQWTTKLVGEQFYGEQHISTSYQKVLINNKRGMRNCIVEKLSDDILTSWSKSVSQIIWAT